MPKMRQGLSLDMLYVIIASLCLVITSPCQLHGSQSTDCHIGLQLLTLGVPCTPYRVKLNIAPKYAEYREQAFIMSLSKMALSLIKHFKLY